MLIQKLIDLLYRYPRAAYKRYQRFGGIMAYRRMLAGQRAMMLAAVDLPPVLSIADGLPVYFLTGKKYLHQTLFCIASLTRVTSQNFYFILVDDGSFNPQLIDQINRQLPGARVIQKKEVDALLSRKLPPEKYPVLNKKRTVYPHIKKLTDIHALPGNEWKVVLDSDMLFWQKPTELLNWLMKPTEPLYMIDEVESYGYPRQLMKDLCGHEIPALLNVGIIGLNSRAINWDDVENWVKRLEDAGGASYYLEQALTAMLVAGQTATVLSAGRYIVNPEKLSHDAVLHHYVDLSKKIYYQQAWKKLIN